MIVEPGSRWGERGLHHAEQREDVHRERVDELVVGDVGDLGLPVLLAGAGDDGVQAAELGDGAFDQRGGVVLGGQVAGDGDGLASGRLDEGDDALRVLLLVGR